MIKKRSWMMNMEERPKSLVKRWLWLIVLSIVISVLTVLIIITPDFWLGVWVAIEPWLWLIISIIAIFFGYKFVVFLIKRYIRKSEKIPKDAINGIIVLVRIITAFAILFVILPALNISSEYLIDISTILATAIGFASTLAVSNLVAGFYMILTNPYKVGDFISIDGAIEGIVKEIGLNYTKIQDTAGTIIQIPNNKLLSSNLTNFKIKHTKKTEGELSYEEKFISVLSNILISDEIIHYVFNMEIALDLDPEETITILDQICDRWKEKFEYRPQYFFKNLYWRGEIQWVLNAADAKTIMNFKDNFLEDIWLSVYKYEEVK